MRILDQYVDRLRIGTTKVISILVGSNGKEQSHYSSKRESVKAVCFATLFEMRR